MYKQKQNDDARVFKITVGDMDSEDNRQKLYKLVGEYFDGATIHHHHGLWKGELEYSITVEIVALYGNYIKDKVFELANRAKKEFNQETVLVQYYTAKGGLV